MKETRSSKGPKNRSEIIEIWSLDLFYEQVQNLKKKGKEVGFLVDGTQKMEEDSSFLLNGKRLIL